VAGLTDRWQPSTKDPEYGTEYWTTNAHDGTVVELILDVLGTHRGEWLTVPEIQRVACRARPSVNGESVRVEVFNVVRSTSSVERRTVWDWRWERGVRPIPEEFVQLRVR